MKNTCYPQRPAPTHELWCYWIKRELEKRGVFISGEEKDQIAVLYETKKLLNKP